MTPLAPDIGDDGGDLVVIQHAQRGHFQFVSLFQHGNRPAQAVQHDARDPLGRAGGPGGVDERRGKPLLTESMLLVTRETGGFIDAFAFLKAFLFGRGERDGFGSGLGRGR